MSVLIHEASWRAGKILVKVNHAATGAISQTRDEIFIGQDLLLLMDDSHNLVITGLYAAADRDAEIWGCVLLFTTDREVRIKDLAEDGCIPCGKFCTLVRLYFAMICLADHGEIH